MGSIRYWIILVAVALLKFSHTAEGASIIKKQDFDPELTDILTEGLSVDEDQRIVGGIKAPQGVAPYQVSIRNTNNFHFCGGSILNEKWVLTAAHCVLGQQPKNIRVVVGTNSLSRGGKRYSCKTVIPHEQYDQRILINDIALLMVEDAIQFNELVQPIAIPKEDISGGQPLVLTGWGRTNFPGFPSNDLQIINLKSIDYGDCKKRMIFLNIITEKQICSLTKKGEGACHGDSGGPLVSRGEVVGVVSWGMPCARGYPDVYSRVFSYRTWIEEQMKAAVPPTAF